MQVAYPDRTHLHLFRYSTSMCASHLTVRLPVMLTQIARIGNNLQPIWSYIKVKYPGWEFCCFSSEEENEEADTRT